MMKCREELAKESQNYGLGRYGRSNKGNKLLSSRRSSRRFSVGALMNSDSCNSVLNGVHSHSFNRHPRLSRTNSLSEASCSSLLGFTDIDNHENGSDKNDCNTDHCDSNCDTSENNVLLKQGNRVVEDSVGIKVMNNIPECPLDCENNDAIESQNNINEKDTGPEDDENNNPIPRSSSSPTGK